MRDLAVMPELKFGGSHLPHGQQWARRRIKFQRSVCKLLIALRILYSKSAQVSAVDRVEYETANAPIALSSFIVRNAHKNQSP